MPAVFLLRSIYVALASVLHFKFQSYVLHIVYYQAIGLFNVSAPLMEDVLILRKAWLISFEQLLFTDKR